MVVCTQRGATATGRMAFSGSPNDLESKAVLYVPTSTQEPSDSVSSPGVDANKATEGLNSEERPGVHPIPPQPVSQHAPVTPVLGHPLVMCPQGVSPLRQKD